MPISIESCGAVGDGITDCTSAIQTAINTAFAAKDNWTAGPGEFKVTSTINVPVANTVPIEYGITGTGAGMGQTVFKAGADNLTFFKWTQPPTYNFQMGSALRNMKLDGNGCLNTEGLRLQANYHFELNQVLIANMKGNGVTVKNYLGDLDASNNLRFINSKIFNCSSWGIKTDLVSGVNETSFMTLDNTFITDCGTAAGGIGGGMYYRGQCLVVTNSAFVCNRNRGFYLEGGAGLGGNVSFNNTAFENNYNKGVEIWGGENIEFNNIQIYNNNTCTANYGIYLNGTSSVISSVVVRSCKVRATNGNNPYTIFYGIGNSALYCQVYAYHLNLDNFWHPGQVIANAGWTLLNQ